MINFTLFKEEVVTNDNKMVSLCLQCIKNIDDILISNIEKDIGRSMSVNLAITQRDIQYREVVIKDKNNNDRYLSKCFIIECDRQTQNVVGANIISFVEYK